MLLFLINENSGHFKPVFGFFPCTYGLIFLLYLLGPSVWILMYHLLMEFFSSEKLVKWFVLMVSILFHIYLCSISLGQRKMLFCSFEPSYLYEFGKYAIEVWKIRYFNPQHCHPTHTKKSQEHIGIRTKAACLANLICCFWINCSVSK